MNRLFLAILFYLTLTNISIAQSVTEQKVFTKDIDNFWIAYDSVKSTTDSVKQAHFVQTIYVDKGTPGLKSFMKARNYSTELYIKLINKYPEFWTSIRPKTLQVKNKTKDIEGSIAKLKILYPELKNAKMYFTIGGLRSGGTTTDSMVLIGAEIATGDSTTNVSEFSNKWLAGVFKEQSSDNLVSLNVHEYIHTQQNGESDNLLAQAIKEGSCDFMAELVIGKSLQRNYITYGQQHKKELKETFKKDMFTTAYDKWLYNGNDTKTVADLGYFMGYEICKSYYANAKNKKRAIKEIIELNYSDTSAVEGFLKKSRYYTEPIDKEQLMLSFREKQPQLLNLEPFNNGDTMVDTSLKQITIVFSKPMGKGYSINYGNSGKDFYPITGVVGFSDDRTKFSVNIVLKPNHEYEFIITNRSFNSSDGYPLLQDYTIKFKTKP
ncbi:Ig-like domain-containing protein [Parafilimonas sp.]|uniref:Ig-like domain-containing protein n=1 Tax=Parafilimonas sp. TaxID=1969739 RepID=UPI0039E518E1